MMWPLLLGRYTMNEKSQSDMVTRVLFIIGALIVIYLLKSLVD